MELPGLTPAGCCSGNFIRQSDSRLTVHVYTPGVLLQATEKIMTPPYSNSTNGLVSWPLKDTKFVRVKANNY